MKNKQGSLWEFLLDWRLTGWFFGRWRNPIRSGSEEVEPEELPTGLDGGKAVRAITFGTTELRPRGFAGKFDPAKHPALPAIQKRSAQALFARLGLDWVPGEYWEILTPTSPHRVAIADPVDALKEFCRRVGIDAKALGRRDEHTIALLQQYVGILVELSLLTKLSVTGRERVLAELRHHDFGMAEMLINRARLTFQILDEAEAGALRVRFPQYHAFIGAMREYHDDPFALTDEEAEEARDTYRAFYLLTDRFEAVCTSIDGQMAWLEGFATSLGDDSVRAILAEVRTLRANLTMPLRGIVNMDAFLEEHDLQCEVERLEAIAAKIAGDLKYVLKAVQEAHDLRKDVMFLGYEEFLKSLQGATELTREDAKEVRETTRGFAELQKRFEDLITALDAQIGILLGMWPKGTKDAWDEETQFLAQGIIRVKEEIETALKTSADVDITESVDSLQQVLIDLVEFIREVQRKTGTWADPVTFTRAAWEAARKLFGLNETATEGEIKKKYRQFVAKHHPDKYPGAKHDAATAKMWRGWQDAYNVLLNKRP